MPTLPKTCLPDWDVAELPEPKPLGVRNLAGFIGQAFYNMECGRYALYTGEPVFTGFLRAKPGPQFWMGTLPVSKVPKSWCW